MLLAIRLHHLRIQKGLFVSELAEQSGLSASYISQIEKGQAIPSCQALDRLAEALDVPLYRLFYDDDPPPTPWLTPRPTLDELMAPRFGPKFETGVSIENRVRAVGHDVRRAH
jgi:transcriptional regulator with XRE-family HTH domain